MLYRFTLLILEIDRLVNQSKSIKFNSLHKINLFKHIELLKIRTFN